MAEVHQVAVEVVEEQVVEGGAVDYYLVFVHVD